MSADGSSDYECSSLLVFVIDGTHKGSGRGKDIIHENKDSLLRCKLDTFSAHQPLLNSLRDLPSSPDDINELTNSQILLVSNLSAVIAQALKRTAGTRYFFLSIVGISLFSAFSQITYLSATPKYREALAAYGDPIGVLLTDSLGFCLTLVCGIEGGMKADDNEVVIRRVSRRESTMRVW